MKLEMKDPQTGRQIEVGIPDWQLLVGMMGATTSFRSLASIHILGAMISNRDFEPARDEGEDGPQAYARRAVDYAEALETELHRRQAAASAERKEKAP
jgi:hypothetical protein